MPQVLPHVAPKCLRSGKSRAEPSTRPVSGGFTRPGRAEIAIVVGFAVMFVAVAGGLVFTMHLELGPVLYGLLR